MQLAWLDLIVRFLSLNHQSKGETTMAKQCWCCKAEMFDDGGDDKAKDYKKIGLPVLVTTIEPPVEICQVCNEKVINGQDHYLNGPYQKMVDGGKKITGSKLLTFYRNYIHPELKKWLKQVENGKIRLGMTIVIRQPAEEDKAAFELWWENRKLAYYNNQPGHLKDQPIKMVEVSKKAA